MYATFPGGFVMPCFDPVLTTTHSFPDAIIAGRKTVTPFTAPRKLTPKVRRYALASPPTAVPPSRDTPALFARNVGGPYDPSTRDARSAIADASDTSHT